MKYRLVPRTPKDKYVAVAAFTQGHDQIVLTPARRYVVEVGIGKREEMDRRKLILAVRKAVAMAKNMKVKRLAVVLAELTFPHLMLSERELAELLVVNAEMANFEFVKYRTRPKEGWNVLEEVLIVSRPSKDVETGIRRGRLIGSEVNNTRILANTPGGDMTPSRLADAAIEAVEGLPVRVEVLGVDEMRELGMGAILGVGKGSVDQPRFIIMEYMGGETHAKPVVLVGKGVTFDTGGLNLKPSEAIYEMHMDMSGGAAVIHTLALAARMKLPRNVVGLIPAVENMPSGSSYRPGDVLRSMSGKTIEILNTDAEGRVILADALYYAKRYKPALVVDVATLTGAAMVALGNKASAIFTKDEELERKVRAWGEESGDYVWPLPLWEEYEADIKGTFGDWANVGKGKLAGAIAGAVFLYQWAKDYPWIHIDMAPRMTSAEGEHLAKGATGTPVRLLWKILEQFGTAS
jgi:leucyl aminopeptidase